MPVLERALAKSRANKYLYSTVISTIGYSLSFVSPGNMPNTRIWMKIIYLGSEGNTSTDVGKWERRNGLWYGGCNVTWGTHCEPLGLHLLGTQGNRGACFSEEWGWAINFPVLPACLWTSREGAWGGLLAKTQCSGKLFSTFLGYYFLPTALSHNLLDFSWHLPFRCPELYPILISLDLWTESEPPFVLSSLTRHHGSGISVNKRVEVRRNTFFYVS